MGIGYMAKRIFRINKKQAFGLINEISGKTGRAKAGIFFDMIYCGLRYGCGPMDYKMLEFATLDNARRKTYVTRGVNNKLVKKYNKRRDIADKRWFLSHFPDYIGREWIEIKADNYDEFKKFVSRHPRFISKPADDSCGRGVSAVDAADITDLRAFHAQLYEKRLLLAEEIIVQHEDMKNLYAGSVNTVRLVTITKEQKPELVFAFIRIGNGNRMVDNLNNGGMASPLDRETGVITHPAADRNSDTYDTHPISGARITSAQIPCYKEAVALVFKAAVMLPETGYVGWDVAVTPEGPVLVEANPYPGHDIIQLPVHIENRTGLKNRVERFL